MEQTVDWHQHWSRPGTPGFHENRVNKYLRKYLNRFQLNPGDRVFVPLCGKAVDLLWLAQQGYNVTGVELSEKAVREFFSESGLEFNTEQRGPFQVFRSDHITIYQGNFMHLLAEDLTDCKLVYDRAAIVAIEAHNRALYCEHMLNIVPERTPQLMVLVEYDQSGMKGPPFSVPVDEVEHHYASAYQIQQLDGEELIDKEPRWRQKGLKSFHDAAVMLTPRP